MAINTFHNNDATPILSALTNSQFMPSATNNVANNQLKTFNELFYKVEAYDNGSFILYPIAVPGDSDESPIHVTPDRLLHLIGVTMPQALRQAHFRLGGVNKYFPIVNNAVNNIRNAVSEVVASPLTILKQSLLKAVKHQLDELNDDRMVESFQTVALTGKASMVVDVDTTEYVSAVNAENNKIHLQRGRGLFIHQDNGKDNSVRPTDSEAAACGLSASKSMDVYQLDISVVGTDLIISYMPEADDVTVLLTHKLGTFYKKVTSAIEGRKDVITVSLKPANCKQ